MIFDDTWIMEPYGSFVRSSYFHVAALRLSDRLEISFVNVYTRAYGAM